MEAFFIPIRNPNLISLINRRWSAYQGLLLIYSSKTPIFMMHTCKRDREIVRGVVPISLLPVSALLLFLLMVIWCMWSEMKVLEYKHEGSAFEWYDVFLGMQISYGSSLQVLYSSALCVKNAPQFCFLNISNHNEECLHFITGL